MRDALGMTSDRVYRWRLLLEEYGPEIVWIKGIHNTVADALSRLEYDPTKNTSVIAHHERMQICCMLFRTYEESCDEAEKVCHMARAISDSNKSTEGEAISDTFTRDAINRVFASVANNEDEIYPVTVSQIAEAQRSDSNLKAYFETAQHKRTRSRAKKRKKDAYT